ncbi:hypothetical protein V2J09_007697 [Rumex salicifolius]
MVRGQPQDSEMAEPPSVGSVAKRSLRRKVSLKNYDENLMDELIEKHLGGPLKKRNRTKEDLEKETETEAMIALSLGFPIETLLEEEIKAGVVQELGGKEQNDYIVVRNHILAKWRSNVHVWITKAQMRETLSGDYEHLISAAYDFLLYSGYINFGVSSAFTSHNPDEATEGSVIIVGAGLAGLAAARQLLSFGFKVLVLEGRTRPGGRVYTQKMHGKGLCAAVDLGGSVITGIHANPLGVLARQLSIPLHKVRDSCPLYRPDGSSVDKDIDLRVEFIFNKLLDKVTELRKMMSGFASDISLGSVLETLKEFYAVAESEEESQLLDWHLANLEYANAGCLSELSAAYWDQDDPYEMGGDHCFLAGGNWRLIKALCEGIPILYGKTVHTIRYGSMGVEVLVGDRVFKADKVLCTVPLGVLKKKGIKFEPELPQRKLGAIERLGFGLLNKVAMIFPHNFWGDDLDTFGCLSGQKHKRGEFFLFYSYHTVSGGSVLIALVAGEAAKEFEHTDPSILLNRVLDVLRGIYNPKGIVVPNPVQASCTKWGSDPFSYGSYSHVRVLSSGTDYDIMAESVEDRLFFAGEATIKQHPATMHGAFISGQREAACILRASKGQQTYTEKSKQKNVVPNSDLLQELFKKPDLEVGKFLIVLHPSPEAINPLGLLRVTFEEFNSGCNGDCCSQIERDYRCPHHDKLPLHLYSPISKEQAQKLQLLKGGDEDRISYLINNLGLELMGPSALGSIGNTLITNISSARKGRGRGRPRIQTQNAGM